MLGITQEPNSLPPWNLISSNRRNRNEVETRITADLLVAAEKNAWGRGRGRLGWESFRPSSALVVRERITEKVTFTPRRKQRRMWAMLVTGRAFTTGVIRAKAWPWVAPSQDASWRCPFCFLLLLQFILPSSSKPSLAQHRGTHSCDPRDETHYHFLDLSSWMPNKFNFSPVLFPSDKTMLREAETNGMHPIYSAIIVYNYIKDAMLSEEILKRHNISRKISSGFDFQHCFRGAENWTRGVVPAKPMLYHWAKPSALTSYNSE